MAERHVHLETEEVLVHTSVPEACLAGLCRNRDISIGSKVDIFVKDQ